MSVVKSLDSTTLNVFTLLALMFNVDYQPNTEKSKQLK